MKERGGKSFVREEDKKGKEWRKETETKMGGESSLTLPIDIISARTPMSLPTPVVQC